LPETSGRGAWAFADKIRRHLADEHIPAAGRDLQVSMSGGVSGPSGLMPQERIAEADRHLYEAKKAGRNCVQPVPDPDAY
jgi:PleD family two-component response regulator